MSDVPTNLEVLKRSRKKPKVGDVFAMRPPGGKYLFGRVIRTDAMGPSRFQTIENRPLEEGDVLERHCWYVDGRYFNEDWEMVPERTEPCGIGGLASYRRLDDQISDALGIPRVPE